MKITHASERINADYQIAQMMDQPGGLEKIALEKLPPFIREMRDYEAFGRNVLLVHNVTSEQLQIIDAEPYVYYPKDFDSHAAFYADDAQVPRLQIEGTGVNVGIVTVMADNITINIKRLMVQKYDYLERTRELSAQAIAKSEDGRIINLVETLLQGSGSASAPEHVAQIVTTSDTALEKSHLLSLRKKIEQYDIPVASMAMNQATILDMLGWESGADIDQLTQREFLESGVRYTIWGSIKLVTSRIIPATTVYAFAEAEYVGRMPILKDLTIKLTETPNKLEQGLFMYEFVGFYMASHKAVAKLLLAWSSGDKIKLIDDVDGLQAKAATPGDAIGSREGN
jgi:hypothetical protein